MEEERIIAQNDNSVGFSNRVIVHALLQTSLEAVYISYQVQTMILCFLCAISVHCLHKQCSREHSEHFPVGF